MIQLKKNHVENKSSIEGTHYSIGSDWRGLYFDPQGITVQPESNNSTYTLTWTSAEKFNPNAPQALKLSIKIFPAYQDTLTFKSNELSTGAVFTSASYKVVTSYIGGSIVLPKTGDIYDGAGKSLARGVAITDNTPGSPNYTPTVTNIVGKVFAGKDKPQYWVKDQYGEKLEVTIKSLTTGVKIADNKADYDTTRGIFVFNDIPGKQAEYELTVNQKLDSSWADFGQWINTLGDDPALVEIGKAIAGVATDDRVLKGTAKVKVAADGTTTPVETHVVVTAITVTAEEKAANAFAAALEGAIDWVVGKAQRAIEKVMLLVNDRLEGGNFMGDDPALKDLWKTIRNITLSVLTLGILLIAFANILQIDIEKYNVTRMIPKLVIATVMSYFSFLIANFLLSITAAIGVKLIAETGTVTAAANVATAIDAIKASGELIGYFLLLIPILIMTLIAGIILWILLTVRIAVLWLLIAVSPLAFMMQVMPFTEHLYMDWWNRFFKWAFMGPTIMFLLFLAAKIIGSSSAAFGSSASDPFFQLILATILIFMSTIVPFTMGGDVFKGIGIDQQSLWRQAPLFKEGQAFIKQRGKPGADRADRRATAARSWVANRNSWLGRQVGQFAAGVTRQEAVGLSGKPKDDLKKVFDGADKGALNKYIAETRGRTKWGEAAFDHAVEKGKLDMKDARVAQVVEEKLGEDMGANFDKIVKAITKEAPDAFAEAVNNGRGGPQVVAAAESSIRRRKDEDLKTADLEFMSGRFRAGTASNGITNRVQELANNKGKLDKILGLSQDLQAQWGDILANSGNFHHTDPEINGKIQQIISANRP